MTEGGDARAPHHETGVVHAHAPGIEGGDTAVVLVAEATVTAMSRAPGISKYSSQFITEVLLS